MKTKPCRCCDGSGRELDDAAVGTEMKKLRVAAGISMARMGRIIKLSGPYLCDLEHGRRHWSDRIITLYRKACE